MRKLGSNRGRFLCSAPKAGVCPPSPQRAPATGLPSSLLHAARCSALHWAHHKHTWPGWRHSPRGSVFPHAAKRNTVGGCLKNGTASALEVWSHGRRVERSDCQGDCWRQMLMEFRARELPRLFHHRLPLRCLVFPPCPPHLYTLALLLSFGAEKGNKPCPLLPWKS